MAKKAYRVRNWGDYNKSLVERGSITFWFSASVFDNWNQESNGKPHGNQKFSDMVIKCAWALKQVYRLTLRATEGMIKSILKMMNLSQKAPDYTTLCRRGKTLAIDLNVPPSKKARHVLVDSTGIQVVGEGEWKTLQHGKSRRQVWRKLHLAMDENDQTILSATMTDSVRLDGNYLPGLIREIEGRISQITGDGAYDKTGCYQAAHERGAKAVFPPQHNASVQRNKIKKDPALLPRDELIRYLNDGSNKEEKLKQWKEMNNYHRRSLVETMMSRMKSIFGDQMRPRSFENQRAEVLMRCYVINKMNALGLPSSYCIG